MNTRHAQLILTIVREGSFTAAAKALFITQPTLSQTVRQIETQLGEPIFVRGKAPLTLTPAGELYTQAARRMLQIETQLSEAISLLHGKAQGVLRLGFTLVRSDELLPQVLQGFYAVYPDVRLEVTEATAAQLEQLLIRGELDTALLSTERELPQLCYRQIASEEIVLLAGRRSALAQRIPSGSTVGLREAAGECFILPREGTSMCRRFDELLASSGVAPKISMRCDNIETAKRVCAACDHVMLSPFISLLCDSASMQKLAHYHLSQETFLPPLYLAYPKDQTPAPYAEALYTQLTNRFRAMTAYRE